MIQPQTVFFPGGRPISSINHSFGISLGHLMVRIAFFTKKEAEDFFKNTEGGIGETHRFIQEVVVDFRKKRDHLAEESFLIRIRNGKNWHFFLLAQNELPFFANREDALNFAATIGCQTSVARVYIYF